MHLRLALAASGLLAIGCSGDPHNNMGTNPAQDEAIVKQSATVADDKPRPKITKPPVSQSPRRTTSAPIKD